MICSEPHRIRRRSRALAADGQLDPHGGALPNCRAEVELAVVLIDHLAHEMKAQTGALSPSRACPNRTPE